MESTIQTAYNLEAVIDNVEQLRHFCQYGRMDSKVFVITDGERVRLYNELGRTDSDRRDDIRAGNGVNWEEPDAAAAIEAFAKDQPYILHGRVFKRLHPITARSIHGTLKRRKARAIAASTPAAQPT